MEKVDLVVKGGEVWTPGGFVEADVAILQGKVVGLGMSPAFPESFNAVIEAKGKVVLSGFIDTNTHHREPGFIHKEDITTATQAE